MFQIRDDQLCPVPVNVFIYGLISRALNANFRQDSLCPVGAIFLELISVPHFSDRAVLDVADVNFTFHIPAHTHRRFRSPTHAPACTSRSTEISTFLPQKAVPGARSHLVCLPSESDRPSGRILSRRKYSTSQPKVRSPVLIGRLPDRFVPLAADMRSNSNRATDVSVRP